MDPDDRLLLACKEGRLDQVKRLLAPKILIFSLRSKANLHMVDKHGQSPLHAAAANGHTEVVAFLITQGADPNAPADNGETPLHLASLLGRHERTAKQLIASGANINAVDRYKATPLHLAPRFSDDEIARLLIENGAHIHARDVSGDTPLHSAAREGHREISYLLLEKGAEVDAQGDHGCTPLHLASRLGHQECVALLITRGADVNAVGAQGRTPLHEAIRSGHTEVVRQLIKANADINSQDSDGISVVQYCASIEQPKPIMELLLASGADASAVAVSTSSCQYCGSVGNHSLHNGKGPVCDRCAHNGSPETVADVPADETRLAAEVNEGAGGDSSRRALYVLEDGEWVCCDRMLVMLHGLDLSNDEEDIDRECGCSIVGQLIRDSTFTEIVDIEYDFKRSTDSASASREIALRARDQGLASFVFPEVKVLWYKVSVGLAYRSSRADKKAVLIGMNDEDYFRSHVKVMGSISGSG